MKKKGKWIFDFLHDNYWYSARLLSVCSSWAVYEAHNIRYKISKLVSVSRHSTTHLFVHLAVLFLALSWAILNSLASFAISRTDIIAFWKATKPHISKRNLQISNLRPVFHCFFPIFFIPRILRAASTSRSFSKEFPSVLCIPKKMTALTHSIKNFEHTKALNPLIANVNLACLLV